MNINDLENFRLSDAVKFHNTLNPDLFTDERMQADVRKQLLEIAEDFVDFMGIDSLKVSDIRLYGSSAAYTYTKHSDIDLHILVDMSGIDDDEVYSELFNSKKRLYNDNLDITVRGLPVELYMQDDKEEVKSLGDYSVMNDRWVKFPKRAKASLEEHSVREKFKRLIVLSELALRSDDIDLLDSLLDTIRRYRQAGLEEGGEFSPENIAYKSLRSKGIVDKLYKHRDVLHSDELSIDEAEFEPEVVSDPIETKLMTEFKQFMESSGYIPSEPRQNWKMAKSNMSGYQLEQAHWKRQSRLREEDKTIKFQPQAFINEYIERVRTNTLWESNEINEMLEFQKFLLTLDRRSTINLRIGSKISILQFTPLTSYNIIQVNGFLNPKTVSGIDRDIDGDINWIEFADGTTFPDKEFIHNGKGGQWEGITTLFFNNRTEASHALVQAELHGADGWRFGEAMTNETINESSGYIPSYTERNDPRFKTALSVDVDPNIMPRQAKAMGLGTINRDGRPQQMNPSGKFIR